MNKKNVSVDLRRYVHSRRPVINKSLSTPLRWLNITFGEKSVSTTLILNLSFNLFATIKSLLLTFYMIKRPKNALKNVPDEQMNEIFNRFKLQNRSHFYHRVLSTEWNYRQHISNSTHLHQSDTWNRICGCMPNGQEMCLRQLLCAGRLLINTMHIAHVWKICLFRLFSVFVCVGIVIRVKFRSPVYVEFKPNFSADLCKKKHCCPSPKCTFQSTLPFS